MKNISITSHAKERAKQRLKHFIDINPDSLEFDFKIKEIFKNSSFQYEEKNINVYTAVYANKVIEFKVKQTFNNYIIITIIVRE